jgi:RNA helicase armi
VATPSNSAANIFTAALKSSSIFKSNFDFIRLVSNNQVEKNLIPDGHERYCATVSISSSKKWPEAGSESPIQKNLTKEDLQNYRIIIGTLSVFGNLMQMSFPEDHFSHVIIDEAGQSTEAETLIPISLVAQHKGQVILAGDPLQLGPISNSRYVKSLNLNFSMMERLVETNKCYWKNSNGDYDPRFVTKLRINYRSIPSILKVYNDLFYKGELESAIDSHTSVEAEIFSIVMGIENLFYKPTNNLCGVFFVDVLKGKNRRVPDSSSWYNEEEINAIMSFLTRLVAGGVEFNDIGIVS